ncbi:MAG: ABC transporter permease subunit, partial [Proteobacteria bacterium]|nr:ABC transporter permease subunit [Pseudomonadota bacterium]
MLSHLTDNLDIWAEGLTNTFLLTVLGIVIGFFVAIPIAVALLGHNRIVSRIAYYYIYVVRGTPLLVQVYIIYYGLGQFHQELKSIGLWWFFRDAFNCGVTAFALNSADCQAELLRGGIQAVPRGLLGSGACLGLSR